MKQKHKPTMEDLFIASVRYVSIVDSQKVNQELEDLRKENNTFYERSLRTFMNVADSYYSEKDIQSWVREKLMNIPKLPQLKDKE